MPIHDWTRVEAGIFHDFHHDWITELKRAMNRLLPRDYYALAEQIIGKFGPDVLALQTPTFAEPEASEPNDSNGTAVVKIRPKVQFHSRLDTDKYASKAKSVVIRHVSNHKIVAMIELVSPGNKHSQHEFKTFVRKAVEAIEAGIHLLIVDLFPPTPRDPQGIHPEIWKSFLEEPFQLPEGTSLTLVSYIGCPDPEAFIEPTAVNSTLKEMPIFLNTEDFIPVPLEATYQASWDGVPSVWQQELQPTEGAD